MTEKPGIVLYLAVLPLVHLYQDNYGLTEQTLTLFPDRKFATEFFEDEVDDYIGIFERRANKYLIGGHVTRYHFEKVETGDDRVVVKVTQYVK